MAREFHDALTKVGSPARADLHQGPQPQYDHVPAATTQRSHRQGHPAIPRPTRAEATMNAIVGRLAPSPTGAQHVGNARTFLIAWLSARQARRPGGAAHRGHRFAARQARRRRASLRRPLLAGSGLGRGPARADPSSASPTGWPWTQLKTTGTGLPVHLHAQRCRAGRECSAPGPRRSGLPGDLCRSRGSGRSRACTAWPTAGASGCRRPRLDSRMVFGAGTHVDLRDVGGDFVVWKAPRGNMPATPAYQLAVVVDDAAQGITEVSRGDDLVPSTPRQLLLYQAPRPDAAAFLSRAARRWAGRTTPGQTARRHPALHAARRRVSARRPCLDCWRGRAAGCPPSNLFPPLT